MQAARVLLLGLAILDFGNSARAQSKPTAKPIDLVLCVDVSGSMQGLIDSAKLKLWDVVNELATLKPTPTLRVGVYSYGGEGGDYTQANGFTRKEIDLTGDLDKVYEQLNALKITGHVEYPTGVAKRTIDDQAWANSKDALKIIFVCGNEESDQDPKVKLDDLSKLAKEKGVIVNAIYCGPATDKLAPGWKQIAEQCGGKFANIDMNKAGTAVVRTPFDKELNELSGKLNSTYVFYGDAKVQKDLAANQSAQDKNAEKAAPGAGASRALSKAGGLYKNEKDAIDAMKADAKFDINKLKDDELPEELKKMKPEERTSYLKKKSDERDGIQKQIKELAAKRAKHIDVEAKTKPKDAGEKALDDALKAAIREQAKDKGFEVGGKK